MPVFVCANCFRTYPPPRQRGRCPECAKAYDRARETGSGAAPANGGTGNGGGSYENTCFVRLPSALLCHHTGTKDNPLSVDHITPRSEGGTDQLSNLRVLCLRCNQSRNTGPKPQTDQRAHRQPEHTNQDDAWSIA